MKKNLGKQLIVGVVLGCMLFTGITAGAMTTNVTGWLYTKNPIYSAPQGYAQTMGYKTISAECSATKAGKTTSQTVTKNVGTAGGSVETDWVYGPTYASSSTTFKSVHTGYNDSGTRAYLTTSYSY